MFPEYSGIVIFPREGVCPTLTRLTLGQDNSLLWELPCVFHAVWHFPGLCPPWQEQPPHLGVTTLRITRSSLTALPRDAVSDRDSLGEPGLARSGRGQDRHACSGPRREAPGCFLGCPVFTVH